MIVHHVGNKSNGEGVGFSSRELIFDTIENDLVKLILKSFKEDDLYHFYFESTLELNPVYTFVRNIFNNPENFITQSNHIAKILYETSIHPRIKAGELSIIYLEECELEDDVVDAIVLIKSETWHESLQLERNDNGFVAKKTNGISLSKIDKGCIIYNTSINDGYKISIIDKINKTGDAKYWKDSFLHVQSYKDGLHQTANLIELCSEFINTSIVENRKLTKVEKAMIAIRSKHILLDAETESISLDEYSTKVFQSTKLSEKFSEFIEESGRANEFDSENIIIKKKAVNKRKSAVSTIKLDDNFELNILGAEERIIKGYDSDAGLNYYKLYFEKEK